MAQMTQAMRDAVASAARDVLHLDQHGDVECRLVRIAPDTVWFALPGRANEDVGMPTDDWIRRGGPETMTFHWSIT